MWPFGLITISDFINFGVLQLCRSIQTKNKTNTSTISKYKVHVGIELSVLYGARSSFVHTYMYVHVFIYGWGVSFVVHTNIGSVGLGVL